MNGGLDRVDELFDELSSVIEHIKIEKPKDKSELDRRFAIVITDLEKVRAYFYAYVLPDSLE